MAFASGIDTDLEKIGSGELIGENHTILTGLTFETGLKIGRFSKLDTGSIDNLDGSANPVIAGIVKRSLGNNITDLGTYTTANNTQIAYVREGLMAVDVKTSETPALFGRVYVSNAGDANDGLATSTNSDLPVSAYFIREIDTNVWLVQLDMSPLAQDLIVGEPKLIAGGADAAAIGVTESGNVAITTAGAETRTLAIPATVGIELTISLDVDGGDAVITAASAINQAGNTIMTMADAGDIIVLKSVQVAGANVWRVSANDGVALS
jgi:hypothetical protein